MREKHAAEGFQEIGEGPALSHLQRNNSVLEKREKLGNVFSVVFEFVQADWHIIHIQNSSLKAEEREDKMQYAL